MSNEQCMQGEKRRGEERRECGGALGEKDG